MQMHLEDVFTAIALNSECPCVVVCDRGVMDGSAYTTQQLWHAILDETGWTTIQLRDKRYDAIVHLVTAADGAEDFYCLDNKARYESADEARALDKKLIEAWTGHPHHFIIENPKVGGFKQKMNIVNETVFKIIGMPVSINYYKKFLL